MHCDHCMRRYERESVAVEAVCVVSPNYGECDTATRNSPIEWSLRVTATQLLKKKAIWVILMQGLGEHRSMRKSIQQPIPVV